MTCMGFQTRIRRNSKRGTELPHVGTVSLGYIFMFFSNTDALYKAAWSKVQSVETTVVVLPDRLIE